MAVEGSEPFLDITPDDPTSVRGSSFAISRAMPESTVASCADLDRNCAVCSCSTRKTPDRAGKRRVGRAVLAVVEGAVTAKILRKREGKYYLAPANSHEQFPDIDLTEDSETWGVIAGVVRRYDLA